MKRRAKPLLERTSRDIFRDAATWAEIANALPDAKLHDDDFVRVLALGSTAPLFDAIRSRGFNGLRELPTGSENVAAFSFSRRYGKNDRHRVHGDFAVAPSHDADVYLLVYVGAPAFLDHGIEFLLDRLLPESRPTVSDAGRTSCDRAKSATSNEAGLRQSAA